MQLTVENLVRSRESSEQSPAQFDEVFRESSATLLAEISNLKTIISRFSEFSRMPQPHFQRVDINEVVRNVVRLLQAQLQSPDHNPLPASLNWQIHCQSSLRTPNFSTGPFSNLALNALDAMPQGGKLTLRTRQNGDRAVIEIADTGAGLTPEECERLFTPYYTSKAHGTGLGLAIVQSIISDHGGRISVHSEPGRGTTFMIELPGNLDKVPASG